MTHYLVQMMKTYSSLILVATLLAPALSANAQEASSGVPTKAFSLSLAVVGERSDVYWTGEGEKMEVHAQQPDAGLPKLLHLLNGKAKDQAKGKDEPSRYTVQLNAASPRFECSSSPCQLATGKNGSYKKFASVKLPQPKGDYTVFLAQNIQLKNWNEPQQLVLSDSASNFSPGSVRIVNLSSLPILIQLGAETMDATVKPGKSKVLQEALSMTNANMLTLWYTTEKGRKKPAFRRKLDVHSKQRMNITCTNSNKPGRLLSSQIFTTPDSISFDKK